LLRLSAELVDTKSHFHEFLKLLIHLSGGPLIALNCFIVITQVPVGHRGRQAFKRHSILADGNALIPVALTEMRDNSNALSDYSVVAGGVRLL
jgi:hypothetical protein